MLSNALQAAHLVITYCTENNIPVSNLSLQKILYFLQVYHMRNHGERLFTDDFYAWQYGPVVPEVYNEYSGYGGGNIMGVYLDSKKIDKKISQRLEPVIDKLSRCKSWELAEYSHAVESPWKKVFRDGEGDRMKIDCELIKNDNTRII